MLLLEVSMNVIIFSRFLYLRSIAGPIRSISWNTHWWTTEYRKATYRGDHWMVEHWNWHCSSSRRQSWVVSFVNWKIWGLFSSYWNVKNCLWILTWTYMLQQLSIEEKRSTCCSVFFLRFTFWLSLTFLEANENDTDNLLTLCLYSSSIGGRIADSASSQAAGGGKITGEVRAVLWKKRKGTREDYR